MGMDNRHGPHHGAVQNSNIGFSGSSLSSLMDVVGSRVRSSRTMIAMYASMDSIIRLPVFPRVEDDDDDDDEEEEEDVVLIHRPCGCTGSVLIIRWDSIDDGWFLRNNNVVRMSAVAVLVVCTRNAVQVGT